MIVCVNSQLASPAIWDELRQVEREVAAILAQRLEEVVAFIREQVA